ncbi:ExeM/NucH family extracellular endonuclease [Cellulomonas alba]|uniref:ExeM/NucH family extracellular endonuclease n=1 Tax=Cellulomonas alba TaxID=3053467 RepID=A0ABT7SJ75_9CELL|nr:ExeM/NucH family extracellular endonuclease [Cellulomonas alba]MDM7856235.1 ExeM/NucH family extracellular endonuclease [Cellulomonas alba]
MHAVVRSATGGLAALGVLVAGAVATGGAAHAAVSPAAAVVVNEVYGGGGNSGAPLNRDFVELYNPGSSAVSLAGWSVQYASAAGSSWANKTDLSGSIAAGGYLLVGGASGANGSALTVDVDGTINLSGSAGKVALVSSGTPLTCSTGCASQASVVDLVGYGSTASSYAGTAPAPGASNTTSVSRSASHTNTADNAADFTAGAPTPQAAGSTPPSGPTEHTIAEIQGTGAASPLVGQSVTTTGVVTAAYPTGGLNGYVIQTAGTGGPLDAGRTASDAVFVFSPATVAGVAVGENVQVTGTVSEYNGLTELTVPAGGVTDTGGHAAVTPTTGAWPTTEAAREAIESMLLAPTDTFTVTDTYATNQYGEVGLATGRKPLLQPTDVARPGTPEAAAVAADNAARGVVLDDGATTNFLLAANQSQTPPYISLSDPLRVGERATLSAPMIVDYRNSAWKLDPTAQVVAGGASPVSFTNNRTAHPADVGGDLRISSFNVLNYFTTLGVDTAGCTAYTDRDGHGITVKDGCDPRGAWDSASLARQQAKIVKAINALDADVVGLMEIENSAVVDGHPDEALATLVDALNAAAGDDVWAYVPSSAELPPAAQMDVITNAIIYRKAAVERVGASHALGTLSEGDEAFANAREPIAQTFRPVGGGEPILVVVNHLKSKGSAGPLPGDADSGDGQGSSNASRVAQATALRDWVPTIQGDVRSVALVGDFNSYTREDPLQVLYDAGYSDAAPTLSHDQWSYSFGSLSGSLDHVLLNAAALKRATGEDTWEINAEESVALEYSRYNYHGTLFYAPDPYRSSDHDPVVVGLSDGPDAGTIPLTFLDFNDFHGRIDANTVKFAGTIEQQRAAASGPVALLAAGDNIGASLFASAVAQDQPTIDVLDALGLQASAVGNHEFDRGFDDLKNRVIDGGQNATWDYLGANVYAKGTTDPVLPEYAILTMGGLKVGVIGAVTKETTSLVSPAGIASLDFGDPVAAVNRVAGELTDGDPSNGEADVLVAEYHEGASAGTPDGATLDEEVAAGGAFTDIVTKTSPKVAAIFTGHTHKAYAWEAPVPGSATATRPVVQAEDYGDFVGKVVLDVDATTHEVTAHTQELVARTTTPDADLVAAYPRAAKVQDIVTKALAAADEVGKQQVGSVSADITTAFSGGSYVGGTYAGGTRDDRASESTLGDVVANALRDTLASPDRGGAQIGVVNPGGLRAELMYARSGAEAADGIVTYAEANSVLPFVNNLWTTTLTGAQVKTMLEQQWQTNADGTIPTRPYLQLGLSDNVSYTFDPAAPRGSHITSVTVDGKALDPAATYRIGTFSFLTSGGDNFRVLAQGADARDSGLVDREAWIAYLGDHPGLTPSFARRAVQVPTVPTTIEAGAALDLAVGGLDLTSLGSPQNTALSVRLDGDEIGAAPVTNGAAQVTSTIPAGTAAGAHVLTLVGAPSGTTVTLPLTVTAAPVVGSPTSTELKVTGGTKVGQQLNLKATVSPKKGPQGTVEFRDGDTVVATATVGGGGHASAKVSLAAGEHSITATFVPSTDQWAGSTSDAEVVTVRAR